MEYRLIVNYVVAALLLWILLVEPALAESDQVAAASRRIAFTFDDAPRPDTACLTRFQRQQRLLQQLSALGDVPAMFMVTTQHIEQHGVDTLQAYVDAGHLLGNHSHSHQHPERMGVDAYLADIKRAHEQLSNWKQYYPYYRFPFLNEGRSEGTRDAIRTTLEELNIKHGYVTIDNYDWYMDHLLQEAWQSRQRITLEQIGQWYADEMVRSVEFYDGIAQRRLGRSPAHVLLLHENDMAALFLDRVIMTLKQKGWTFISPVEAYQDEMAQTLPDTLFNGQGRVAALAEAQGMKRRDLVPENEDEAYLRTAFQKLIEQTNPTESIGNARAGTLSTVCR